MTKQEKQKVRYAINRLHDDDGWDDGISTLKRLLDKNWKSPLDGKIVKYVDVCDLLADAVDSVFIKEGKTP